MVSFEHISIMKLVKNSSLVMKFALIFLGVILIGFTISQVFALYSQYHIEIYPYSTLKTYESFEIRRYEETLFTSVKLSNSTYKSSSSKGFSVLAGYIFGDNDRNEKISMTSPVAMKLEDSVTMMFMVPKKLNKDLLPKPNSKSITIKTEPAKTVAAISFGGWANDEKIKTYKEQLVHELNAKGIAHSNTFYFLGYNAPYEVFNRKNEIIIELN